MIRSLQSFRGIFAIFIFLSHYHLDGQGMMPSGGDLGVAFFIMLSGFVLSAGYEERISSGASDFRQFMTRRLAKTYPLYVLCFVWSLFFVNYPADIRTAEIAVLNLSLLQSWMPNGHVIYSFNPVAWFLSDMLFFYVIFWLVIRGKILSKQSYIAAFAAMCIAFVIFIPSISEGSQNSLLYVFPPARLFDFIIGMLLWKAYGKLRNSRLRSRYLNSPTIYKTSLELLVFVGLSATVYFWPDADPAYRLGVMWWPIMAVIILVFSHSDRNGGAVSRLLSTQLLCRFGEMSFVFYMIHWLGIHTVASAFSHSGIETAPWSLFAITCISVLALTILTDYLLKHMPWNRTKEV